MATRTAVKRITKSYISNTNDSFESLHRLLDETNCMSCKPGPEFKKIPVGTVIDEEKSVRWNREEVERIREEYTEEVKRLNRERNKKYNEVVIRIIALISKETGLSEEKARLLWSFTYEHHHSYGDTLFQYLEEYCDLYNDLK